MRVIVVEGEASETGEHGTSEVVGYADSAKQVMDWLADSTGAEITSDGRWSLGFPETAECSLLRRLQDGQRGMEPKQSLAVLDSIDEAASSMLSATAASIADRVLCSALDDVDWRTLLLAAVYVAVRRSGEASGAVMED